MNQTIRTESNKVNRTSREQGIQLLTGGRQLNFALLQRLSALARRASRVHLQRLLSANVQGNQTIQAVELGLSHLTKHKTTR